MGITCGVDWAEDHHDVVVMDDLGKVLQGRRIGAGVDGYADPYTSAAPYLSQPR